MEAVCIIFLSCVLHTTTFGGRVTGMSGTRGRISVRLLMVLDREIERPTVIITWFQNGCLHSVTVQGACTSDQGGFESWLYLISLLTMGKVLSSEGKKVFSWGSGL